MRHSTAPHLLFVDGDCLLPPDHVEHHLAAGLPGVVTTSYCVRLDECTSQQATLAAVRSGAFQEWPTPVQRQKLRHMHFKSIWYGLMGHATKPAFRSGDFAMSRDDFELVNGFDENFQGWGCEDDDFGRRLRRAGVRTQSVLNRTCVYHLWHPPAPTRPRQWKRGSNVEYLQRTTRMTRCLNGLASRQPADLTVRLVDTTASGRGIRALLVRHGWNVETSWRVRTDLELLCLPGRGRFTTRTDCRVAAVLDEASFDPAAPAPAHIVLSASGQAGGVGQIRLRLDDVSGFWAALNGQLAPHRRTAA